MPSHGTMKSYDLIVIGSGPAGEKGAAQAAYFGRKVALVEGADALGGTAANYGTLASKTLREIALAFRRKQLLGETRLVRDPKCIEDYLNREDPVKRTEQARILENLRRHGVDLHHGFASFTDEHTITIQRRNSAQVSLRADFFLVAAGSSPYRPPLYPWTDPRVYDYSTILGLRKLPRRILIAGGGRRRVGVRVHIHSPRCAGGLRPGQGWTGAIPRPRGGPPAGEKNARWRGDVSSQGLGRKGSSR